MPAPAKKRPTGTSQGAPRRSANRPKSGCRTEEVTLEANTRPAAAAMVKPRSVTKKGISAGITPWLTSSQRCAAESSAIGRFFIGATPGREAVGGTREADGKRETRYVTDELHFPPTHD